MNHKSPLPVITIPDHLKHRGKIDPIRNLKDLANRCPDCRARIGDIVTVNEDEAETLTRKRELNLAKKRRRRERRKAKKAEISLAS